MINNSDIDVQGRIDCIRDAISAAVPSTDAIEKLGTMRSDTTDQNSKQQLESDEAPNEPTHKDELRAVRGLESGRLVDGSRTEAEPNVDGAPKTNALIKAPEHWPLSQKETFKALPPATQQLLLDRNTALEKEHTRKMAAIADLQNEYGPIDQLFAPYRVSMRAQGLTARQMIERWANVERRLSAGDGVNVIKGIVEGYGIDANQLASTLGFFKPEIEPNQTDDNKLSGMNASHSTSRLEIALQQLTHIRERLAADDRLKAHAAHVAEDTRRRNRAAEMSNFKAEVDEYGNLLHPYADEVEEDIVHLSHAIQASGRPAPSLQELWGCPGRC